MPKQSMFALGLLGGAIVIGGLAYFIVTTNNDRRATQEQLDQLKKQIAAATGPAPAPAPAVILGASTAQSGSALERERATNEVIVQGGRLLDTGDPQKALVAAQIFRDGIDKIDPKNTDFYVGLGRAHLLAKQYGDATQDFRAGLQINPKRTDLWNGIAAAYWALKDFYHAKFAYEQTIAIDPQNIEAWSIMSWVYLGLQDQDGAVKGFQVLVDSGSDRIDWKTGLTMARASNFKIEQIRTLFPLPDPQLFKSEPASTNVPTRPN